MSQSEPILLRPRSAGAPPSSLAFAAQRRGSPQVTAFDRSELETILEVYARKVAAGEWRDYALEMGGDRAVFSIFRRASEYPLYRIEKSPRHARRQGAYSVVAATGLIVQRGPNLKRVLAALESLKLVDR